LTVAKATLDREVEKNTRIFEDHIDYTSENMPRGKGTRLTCSNVRIDHPNGPVQGAHGSRGGGQVAVGGGAGGEVSHRDAIVSACGSIAFLCGLRVVAESGTERSRGFGLAAENLEEGRHGRWRLWWLCGVGGRCWWERRQTRA